VNQTSSHQFQLGEGTTIFKVQLFGRDSFGKCIQRDLGASFATFDLAIDAAEAVAASSAKGSRGTLTNYRITGVSGVILLDVGVYGSERRLTHREDAA
jgi:hypothetical protein